MPNFSNAKTIWSVYLSILVLLAGVLAWFSWVTIRVERESEHNRQQVLAAQELAAHQERIGRALWRMDSLLAPFVAQEAARNHWMYRSFVEGEGAMPVPSPLLVRPSSYVLLHFQIDPQNAVTSPQSPVGKSLAAAMQCGVSQGDIADNGTRLKQLVNSLEFQPLWSACSDSKLPSLDTPNLTWQVPAMNNGQIAGNGDDAVQGQLLNNANDPALAQQSVNPANPGIQQRGSSYEYAQRSQSANNMAISQWQYNRNNRFTDLSADRRVTEGVMRGLWIDDRLFLVRRVTAPEGSSVQGCWLNWDILKSALLEEISDIFPVANLIPRMDESAELSRALASLPVDLSVEPIVPVSGSVETGKWSQVTNGLVIAWGGFLLAGCSTAWLIFSVVQLSERRAAFASAVTHELRTPLTTFRLYSEMLAGDMVQDEASKRNYVAGLVKESDRLCRLVDNVLQFARLERKAWKVHVSNISVRDLMDGIHNRCASRVELAGKEFRLSIAADVENVALRTALEAVEQIVFNLVENACKYATEASLPQIDVSASSDAAWIVIRVRDYGPGIDPKMVKRLFRPFSRSSDETAGTSAGVGLGLSLAKQLARQLNGRLDYLPGNPGSIFELRLRRE
jgi:signal transduction histidine kinase